MYLFNPFTSNLDRVDQTPWYQDVDAASFRLDDVGGMSIVASDLTVQNALLISDERVEPAISLGDNTFATMQISSLTTPTIDCTEANALNLFTLVNEPANTSMNAYGIVGSAFSVKGDAGFLAGLNFNAGVASDLFLGDPVELQSVVGVSTNMLSFGGDILDGGVFDATVINIGSFGDIDRGFCFRGTTNHAVSPWGIILGDFPSNLLGTLSIGDVAAFTAAPASVGLELAHTTRVLRLNRLTTTQRDALTASDGMIFYNTTTSKVSARAGGAWVDLH